ncbi:MAG: hypothetical protein GY838_16705 [bacterium]|nr:hypothetical protein [bacterium]
MNLEWGIALALVAFLMVETILVNRSRRGIPRRIVVTGTRGKSSLVKLLVAGIRTAERDTWGKVTGDVPLLLAPDGSLLPIRRRGAARLHEQRNILRTCHRRGARCLVLESMTISPETMKAEMRLVQPTLVVVTNVRDDHRETLGRDPAEQRGAYLRALPAGVPWVTMDAALGDHVRQAPEVPEPVSGDTLSGGAENLRVVDELLALAETTLAELGWNTPAAREAMRVAAGDLDRPSSILRFHGEPVRLLDLFSANDPESLSRLWRDHRRNLQDQGAWPVLLATRADRPLRTRQFCDWLANRRDVGTVHVAGSHDEAACRLLRSRGIEVARLPSGALVPAPGEKEAPGILVGMGNARGLGLRLRAASAGAVA